jgi:transcription antitermination factor NusG
MTSTVVGPQRAGLPIGEVAVSSTNKKGYVTYRPVSDGAKLYAEFDMASSTSTIVASELTTYPGTVRLPARWAEQRWYAAYTCAQHEKRVAAELGMRQVEHFLPLYSSVRRWKDRRVQLDLPLFPGYVFVRLALRDRLRVLQVPSVVRLVGFNGLPTALPDEEMEILRSGHCQSLHAEPHPFLTVGRRVRITGGPFAGLEGVLKRKKSSLRVVVSLELIQRSVAVDVDAADVGPVVG